MHMAALRSCIVAASATAALSMSGAGAHAASFDCRIATTQVERLICTDSRLSEGDERIAFAYRSALQSALQPDDVRASQRQWLKIMTACGNSACVASAQDARLAQLGAMYAPDTPPPAKVGGTIAIEGHVSITITALRGIGTHDSAIDARMTERDAAMACHGYMNEPVPTRKCIVDWMKEGGGTRNVEYRANCLSGLFRVADSRAAFLGRNAAASSGEVDEPDYLIKLSDTGEFLSGAGASGYPVFLSTFQSLCPGIAERAPRVRR